MSKSHERGLSRGPSRSSAPAVDHQRTVCAVCGGSLAYRSTIIEGDTCVENYRCRGACRGGGHRLRQHGTRLASGGPVFTGDQNHTPTYPGDLTERLVDREVA
ncbi:hypothetical protein RYH80_19145 [Halobaculum sp. MBLA0147]|uniref:hypothetical protein n=1 Tax=Halobaculum sp. MBLA0147 TaxID=3079934 RepID=UPI0035232DFD